MSSGLTPELVMQLMDDGQKQVEIAREFGVSRQYVSKLAREAGFENKYKIVGENLPWDVKPDYLDNTIYKNLRRHGAYMAHGEKLPKNDMDKLIALYRKLTIFNQVVDYDPAYPALTGLSNTPGFTYLPRTEADEDFVIKVRPGINLTRIGDRIWRMPAEIPQ